MKKLFCVQNAKTIKGEALGWRTLILYLAPATEASDGTSKKFTVCPWASPGCSRVCLFSAGRGAFPVVKASRIAKTRMFMGNRGLFVAQLEKEIRAEISREPELQKCVRLNGTSDINWEPLGLFRSFPDVQFYDYTKSIDKLLSNTVPNYHLTFSRSENNELDCAVALDNGHNVAVVFAVNRGKPLPSTYSLLGKTWDVIDGDEHDLRFLDRRPVIVGLRAKGVARKPEGVKSGFVVTV